MIIEDDIWYNEEVFSQICFAKYSNLLQETFWLN